MSWASRPAATSCGLFASATSLLFRRRCNGTSWHRAGVPNMPATPNRTVRVSDELWEAAKRAASDQDETVTDVIRRALERYVRDHPAD